MSRIWTKAAVAVVGGASLALTGCSAGQGAQTADQVAAIDGAVSNAGKIALRDVTFAKPDDQYTVRVGQPARLKFYIVNQSESADTLVSVTSPLGTARLTGNTTIPTDTAVSDTVTADELNLPRAASERLDITFPAIPEPVVPGKAIPVTFLFRDGGQAELEVPLQRPEEPRPDAPEEPPAEGGEPAHAEQG